MSVESLISNRREAGKKPMNRTPSPAAKDLSMGKPFMVKNELPFKKNLIPIRKQMAMGQVKAYGPTAHLG